MAKKKKKTTKKKARRTSKKSRTSKKKGTRKSSRRKSGSQGKKKSTSRKSTQSANGSTEFTARLRNRFEESVDDVRAQLDELEATFEKTFKEIVDRGRKAQEDLGKRVRDARKDLEKNDVVKRVRDSRFADRVRNIDAKKAADRVRKSADTTWKSGVGTIHDVLDLPSKSELEKLTKKVDQLQRKIRTLENRS